MVTPTGAAVLRALARPAECRSISKSRTSATAPAPRPRAIGPTCCGSCSGGARRAGRRRNDRNPDQHRRPQSADLRSRDERLFAAGARDVTLTPTIMKKGRPAITLGCSRRRRGARRSRRSSFAETSTIGMRFHPVSRLKLPREIREVETRWGKIRVKVSGANGGDARRSRRSTTTAAESPTEHRVALRVVMERRAATRPEQSASLSPGKNESERLVINEIFYSIQGESTHAGRPCVFVRLTGCNLRCNYCDTEYAFYEGRRMAIAEVAADRSRLPMRPGRNHRRRTAAAGRRVPADGRAARRGRDRDDRNLGRGRREPARPARHQDHGPEMSRAAANAKRNLWSNLDHLTTRDEVKFVISDRADYEWAAT